MLLAAVKQQLPVRSVNCSLPCKPISKYPNRVSQIYAFCCLPHSCIMYRHRQKLFNFHAALKINFCLQINLFTRFVFNVPWHTEFLQKAAVSFFSWLPFQYFYWSYQNGLVVAFWGTKLRPKTAMPWCLRLCWFHLNWCEFISSTCLSLCLRGRTQLLLIRDTF